MKVPSGSTCRIRAGFCFGGKTDDAGRRVGTCKNVHAKKTDVFLLGKCRESGGGKAEIMQKINNMEKGGNNLGKG